MYAHLFKSVLFPLYESGLRRRNTLRYLAEYEAQQWLPAEAVLELQWKKLRQLLEYCDRAVPYYRRRWRELGISLRDIRTPKDFAHLPVITKDDIRANYEDLVAEPLRGNTLRHATGGSTGQPLTFEYTRESYERRVAVMLRGYAWAGATMGTRAVYLWGPDIGVPGWPKRFKTALHDILQRKKVLSPYGTSVEENIRQINRIRPPVIVGYVSALETLAQHVETSGHSIASPQAVITAAEMLQAPQRALIERVFQAPVFHSYGSREFKLIGAECEFHSGYHTSADHLVVELLDDANQPAGAGVGNVAITDLHNYGMPFIRYLIGDMAHATETRCPCGRGLPLLGKVEGRRLDMLWSADGRMIAGVFFPQLMKEIRGVDRFQVRQTKPDKLEVLIVKRRDFTEQERSFLLTETRRVAGAEMGIEVKFVDDIPLTATGKRRVTIYDVPGHVR